MLCTEVDFANAFQRMAIMKETINTLDESTLLWDEARQFYGMAKVPEGVEECEKQLRRLES